MVSMQSLPSVAELQLFQLLGSLRDEERPLFASSSSAVSSRTRSAMLMTQTHALFRSPLCGPFHSACYPLLRSPWQPLDSHPWREFRGTSDRHTTQVLRIVTESATSLGIRNGPLKTAAAHWLCERFSLDGCRKLRLTMLSLPPTPLPAYERFISQVFRFYAPSAVLATLTQR